MSFILAWALGSRPVSFQPRPTLPTMDATDLCLSDFKLFSDCPLRLFTPKSTDIQNIALCQFRSSMSFSVDMSSVGQLVSLIFLWRLPRKMPLGDTGKMAFAAGMRRLMLWRRGRSINLLAKPTAHEMAMSIGIYASASANVVKGPCQAIVAIIGQNNFLKKPLRFPVRGSVSAVERVPMALPARVVGFAPTTGQARLAAIGNRAYSLSSHCGALHASLVRARRSASNARRVRYLYRKSRNETNPLWEV